MKSIKQIREQYDLITEKESKEESKLTALVRAGLVDTTKLPIIKRALNKDNKVLTPTERNALLALLDSLMAQVLTSHPVYTKVKQNVMSMNEDKEPREPLRSVRMQDMPSIIVLKRRAIRVYPGGHNVGLYYSQQLDRYVAVPFGGYEGKERSVLSMTEEADQLNEIADRTAHNAFAKLHHKAREAANAGDEEETEKYVKKTAKVGLMQTAKVARRDGWKNAGDEAKKMLKYSKKYMDVADLMEVRSKVPRKKKEQDTSVDMHKYAMQKKLEKDRKAKEQESKPTAPVTPKPDKVSGDERKAKKNARGNKWQAYNKDQDARGAGSVVGDMNQHIGSGLTTAIGAAVGGAIYRAKNKTPVPKPVDEGFIDTIKKYGSRVLSSMSSGGGSGSPEDNDEKSGRVRKIKTGRTSSLRLKTSGAADDRNRRIQRSMDPGSRPTQRPPQDVREETTELNLGGNRFSLNSGIANKVLNVYQSLNEDNRQKMVDKMNESEESLNKVISFAIRH
jgi:hypothetical protein